MLSPTRLFAMSLVTALVFAGCKTEPKKSSPDELVAALVKTGVKVEKDGNWNLEANSEMNVKLKFDGAENVTATRFSVLTMARDYCQTKTAGFTVDFWCVSTFDKKMADSPAWTKAKTAATAVP